MTGTGLGWPIMARYGSGVTRARDRVVSGGRKILRGEGLLVAGREERDLGLRERYAELEAEGLRRAQIVARIRDELAAVFTDDELQKIGVSHSMIVLAVKRGPVR